ncbi:Mitochondrial import receptor subunit TOM40-1, partial [Cucurbita argyrosperma subsp. sororia]
MTVAEEWLETRRNDRRRFFVSEIAGSAEDYRTGIAVFAAHLYAVPVRCIIYNGGPCPPTTTATACRRRLRPYLSLPKKKSDEKVDYLGSPLSYPLRGDSLTFIGDICDRLSFLFEKCRFLECPLSRKTNLKEMRLDFTKRNQSKGFLPQPQSVSPHLSLGGEVFWAGQHRKSGIGYAARYNTDKMVATGQVASTGMVALSYVQKVSEKVSLATDFTYNYMSRDVISSLGYDYILRQCRLRGKIDSNGCVAAFLEERLNMGVNFILSAEIDHRKKDYKFGFGLTVGE